VNQTGVLAVGLRAPVEVCIWITASGWKGVVTSSRRAEFSAK
jgi:hypothetical protein